MKHLKTLLLLTIVFYNDILAQDISIKTNVKFPEIEAYVKNEMKQRKIPGLVFGIFQNDELLICKAYGKAEIQNQAPVIPETVFELASITKQFTASGILILQQDGMLSIEDPLKKYFPECPESWNDITLKHLLTHTSGLTGTDGYPGINNMDGARVRKEYADWSKKFLIDALIEQKPEHAPGEIFHYSDPGYALLGIVIDNITGSYRKFIENRIFKPLGMTSTYIVDQETIHPNEARGYTLRNGELINFRRYHNIEIPSWYGVFSNIQDMAKWDAALNSNKILTEKSKELLWTDYTTNDGRSIGYGLGWNVFKFGGEKIVRHTGTTGVDWLKFPNKRVSVVTLTNLGDGGYDNVDYGGISIGIANILGFKVLTDSDYITNDGVKVIPMTDKIIKKIIGKYTLSASWGKAPASIIKENDKVYLSSGGFKFELGLLENGSLIQYGLPFEYILTPNDKSYKTLVSNNGTDTFEKIME